MSAQDSYTPIYLLTSTTPIPGVVRAEETAG